MDLDRQNFENQVFDELPSLVLCSNFKNCTFNVATTFERCNLIKCTFNVSSRFDRSNIINEDPEDLISQEEVTEE